MSKVGAKIKEAAGYVKEETGELLDDKEMANEGRDLRNKGRIEDGKFPKLNPVGTEE